MIVSEATLREAALQLLASSTARRYIREAGRLAAESGLVQALRNDAEKAIQARQRAVELIGQLEHEQQRSPAEFEAALVLCALARIDAAGEAEILREAVRLPSAWIRALAHRLLQLGPPTSEELTELEAQLSTVLTGTVVATPLYASDREDPGGFPRAA